MAEEAIEEAEAAVSAVVAEAVALVRFRVRERALKTSADIHPPQNRRPHRLPTVHRPPRHRPRSVFRSCPSIASPAVLTAVEMGKFLHACEGEIVCQSINTKIPYFNAPIYLENKVCPSQFPAPPKSRTNQLQSVVGKVDEILGPMNQVFFTVKPQDGIVATSFKEGDKFYIGGDKLLPLERFLPKPKIVGPKGPKSAGGRGGSRGGRGAPRGGRGGFAPRGRGGFTPRGRGGFTPRGGSGGFSRGGSSSGGGGFTPRGGRGGFTPRGRGRGSY